MVTPQRREQLRAAKAAQRERERQAQMKTLHVRLTLHEFAQLARCMERQKGPLDTFLERALVTGAKFLANSGQPRGAKV